MILDTSKQYVEIGNAFYDFNSKCFKIQIELVDEIKKDIKSKIIVIGKPKWIWELKTQIDVNYKTNEEKYKEEVEKWLNNFAKSMKSQYENNWNNIPDTLVITTGIINNYKNKK